MCTLLVVLTLVTACGSAWPAVRLPAVIGDNMVLQCGARVPIWGWADPGERVTVSVFPEGKAVPVSTRTAFGDAEGKWMVRMDPLEAGGSYTVRVAGNNTLTVKNVLAGEVWVCSGQSNMQMAVNGSMNATQEIANATYPKIRLFQVKLVTATKPLDDTEGKWAECSPQTVPGFSAVGYFFGRELHSQLGVPVGLVESAWGGTPAEAWTSVPTLKADETFKPILDRWDQAAKNYPDDLRKYNAEVLPAWQKQADEAKAAGKEPPAKPNPPQDPATSPWRAGSLFDGMIAPIVPFGIRGAIWYQGESNASRAYQYRKLMPALITDWRAAWGEGDFPFYMVQLANFTAVVPDPGQSDWAELREAQLLTTFNLRNTGMAVIIDIGDANDIHPKNKQEVGRRLALFDLAKTHGKKVEYAGPVLKTMKVLGNKVRLWFAHDASGLVGQNDRVTGFAVAGEDRKFYWAEARIINGSVVLWSHHVRKPVAVRYAWANNPVCNLRNGDGLPASPFRTDDWPGVTVKNN